MANNPNMPSPERLSIVLRSKKMAKNPGDLMVREKAFIKRTIIAFHRKALYSKKIENSRESGIIN